jgi:hypothetical protein
MAKGNPIPTSARQALQVRDRGQCVRCGAKAREVHHRQRRREGGHELHNLVSLCGKDHRWAHARPSEARADGFIVSVYDDDVAAAPVRAYYGWVRLTTEGGVQWAPQQEPAPPTPS